ncbi:MAG: aldo/keto reductase, partial [Pseudonocardiaceae bacterium]
FDRTNPLLSDEHVLSNAERLGITPAQVALAWTLGLAPNVLLIPGTSSVRHLEENLAVADIELDEDAQQQFTAAAG